MLSWNSSVGIPCWAEQNSPLNSLKDLVEGSGRHENHVPLCECLSTDLIHQPDPLPSAIIGLPRESRVPNQKRICLGGRTHICFLVISSNWGNKSFNFYEKPLDDA